MLIERIDLHPGGTELLNPCRIHNYRHPFHQHNLLPIFIAKINKARALNAKTKKKTKSSSMKIEVARPRPSVLGKQ